MTTVKPTRKSYQASLYRYEQQGNTKVLQIAGNN